MAKLDAKLSQTRDQAWIGDAVLELFARRYILAAEGTLDGAMADRLTSNQFLAQTGNPTEVEAHIGRVYEKNGYPAAEAWIRENLLPRFEKQEKNRRFSGKHGQFSPKR